MISYCNQVSSGFLLWDKRPVTGWRAQRRYLVSASKQCTWNGDATNRMLGKPSVAKVNHRNPITKLLGAIPNRLQLAGGWIDQPFVSRHNPKPPGSMVVV